MEDKKKNKVEEPAEVYGKISGKSNVTNDGTLILDVLLSKSKSNYLKNNTYSTEEAMKIYRDRLNRNL